MSSFPSRTRLAAASAGVLAAAAGLGVSALVAAPMTGVPAPAVSVGNAVIDRAPPGLKDWAVEQLGTADKPVLLGTILLVVALAAAATGVLGLRRPRLAVGIAAGLGALAVLAAATDRTSLAVTSVTVVPAVVALVVACTSLAWLLATMGRRAGAGSTTWADPHPGDDVGADLDRRGFLRASIGTGAAAVLGVLAARLFGGSEAIASRAALSVPRPDLPAPTVPAGARLPVDGLTPLVTPNRDFYRIDTALVPPDVAAGDWSLRVHGLVDRELVLSYADLVGRRLVQRRVTLTCVSNEVGGELAGNASWTGVLLADLLAEAGVQGGADAVLSTSADGFTAGTPLAALTDGRDAMVAVAMNGAPLPIVHGFPARLVVPGLYGYVSATKWVTDLEVTRFDAFSAYWTERGWAEQAPIKTASRIDVPRPYARVGAGAVAVAGVAWAQHRGISRVEVRVDEGEWQQARLAAADGVDTWRQWVWEWPAEPGQHTVQVRATDGSGATQTGELAPPRPDGASGWHTVPVQVT